MIYMIYLETTILQKKKKSQTPGLALNPRAVESSSAQLHLVAALASPNCPASVLSDQVAVNSGHVMIS